jgi:aminoglycoside 3-N-acetyltransferase I
MDLVIAKLTPADYPLFEELLGVYKEAFGLRDPVWPPPAYLEHLLNNPTMTFMVAIYRQKVIGGLTAYTLPSVYHQASEVYLYDLAVRNEWQRRGVGTSLLQQLIDYSTKLGIKEIFVQADSTDSHAIDFYKRNGGIPENVVHFSFHMR